jgi:hypothetical protein
MIKLESIHIEEVRGIRSLDIECARPVLDDERLAEPFYQCHSDT